MRRVRMEDRDRRHYRGRFPMVALLDQMGRDTIGGPRPRTAGQHGRDLVVLAGYGRSAPSLAVALADTGMQVLAFESYVSALDEAHRLEPELILAGHAEERDDVFRFLAGLAGVEWDTTVLFLADSADPDLVNGALEHGADDVVCPPHSVASILLRLHVSRRTQERRGRKRELSRRVSLGRLTVDLTSREVLDGGRPFSLSGREFELLVRLMEAGGEVVSREDLLEDIWGAQQGSAAVLDATVHRLRKRLDEKLREPELVTTVRGVGYRLDSASLEPQGTAAD